LTVKRFSSSVIFLEANSSIVFGTIPKKTQKLTLCSPIFLVLGGEIYFVLVIFPKISMPETIVCDGTSLSFQRRMWDWNEKSEPENVLTLSSYSQISKFYISGAITPWTCLLAGKHN
jgi:hypothetical protein